MPLRCSRSADQNQLKVSSLLRRCGMAWGTGWPWSSHGLFPPPFASASLASFGLCSGCELSLLHFLWHPLSSQWGICRHRQKRKQSCVFPGLFGCPCVWRGHEGFKHFSSFELPFLPPWSSSQWDHVERNRVVDWKLNYTVHPVRQWGQTHTAWE